jgi:hypothetical protein
VSGLDFINYTRRATIEAIHKLNPDTDVLLFNSILNIRKKKYISERINFYYYHFWTVEKLRKARLFSSVEHWLRGFRWRSFFKIYSIVFIIDPNQYYLLPYINNDQKLVYLLRDPNLLLDPNCYNKELAIINRADCILGVSKNLCEYYFNKYYKFVPDKVILWSNSVDLGLWDYTRWESFKEKKERPVVGLAGNIDFVIDIELLIFLAENLPQYDFEIAGKLDLEKDQLFQWDLLLAKSNFRYLGFVPYNDFPKIVINWDIGIVAANPDHDFAKYLNNNKQYQYLALGKPFVSYYLNSNYKEFEDLVFLAHDKDDFVSKISEAIEKIKDPSTVLKGITIARMQSSDCRARQFLEIIETIN